MESKRCAALWKTIVKDVMCQGFVNSISTLWTLENRKNLEGKRSSCLA